MLGVVLREKDEGGRLRLRPRDPPAWLTDEYAGYKHYLWHQGVTEPSDVRRLYGAYRERRRAAAAADRAALTHRPPDESPPPWRPPAAGSSPAN